MTEKVSALEFQVEGDHYKKLKMQPLEFAYKVNGSPCFTKLAKYASRDKVDRLADLKKALHCIQLEQELSEKTPSQYHSIKVKSEYFYNVLNEFTAKGYLWHALEQMYWGNYNVAMNYVEVMIQEEFPNESRD